VNPDLGYLLVAVSPQSDVVVDKVYLRALAAKRIFKLTDYVLITA
jgi:hypothetical protein